jgi:[ribosomal protein S5]-alanine N-acetyltransferase
MTTIETERLILRPARLADIRALFTFLGDAGAMRHTHCDRSVRACRRRVGLHERLRRTDGFAPWTVATKATGGIIGWGGLYTDPFDQGWGVEIGYCFHPVAWGKGYASELVRRALTIADHELKLPEVRAFARPANKASRRVLEKAGFEIVTYVPAMERWLYRRRNPSLRATERSH